MNLDAAQYQQIATIVYGGPEIGPTAAEAELVVSLCQLAVQADEVEDADEAALFRSIAMAVYGHANIDTTPPDFHPLDRLHRSAGHPGLPATACLALDDPALLIV